MSTTESSLGAWSPENHFAAFWADPNPGGPNSRLHPDVVGYWPGGAVVRGVEAYNKQLKEVISLMPDVTLSVLDHAQNGETAFIRWKSSGTSANGPFEMEGVDRLTFKDGRIIENRVFFDAAEFERLIGVVVPGSTPGGAVTPEKIWPDGKEIPKAAADMVKYTGVAYVATTNEDGTPNLSPKGTLKVLDKRTMAFGDIASPGTMQNLKHNPYTEINILDPFLRKGYRFKCVARIRHDRELYDQLLQDLLEEYPIRAAVELRVLETRPLISPAYMFHQISENEMRKRWEKNLGYAPIDRK